MFKRVHDNSNVDVHLKKACLNQNIVERFINEINNIGKILICFIKKRPVRIRVSKGLRTTVIMQNLTTQRYKIVLKKSVKAFVKTNHAYL